MGLARRAQGARRRRCGDIVDDEQRRYRLASPMRPLGFGQAGASAALALLEDDTASPASRRLASAPAWPETRCLLIPGQAPGGLADKMAKAVAIASKAFAAWSTTS